MTTTSKPRQPVVPGSTGAYAVLPLRDIVVFPHMIVPLFVGREKSIRALEEVVKADRHILLATQVNATDDDPAPSAIYEVGTLANVLQLLKLPDGTVKVLVEGASRARIKGYTRTDDYYEAEAEAYPDNLGDKIEAEALARSVVSEFENYVKLNKKISPEVVSAVTQIEEPSKLADTVASHLAVKIADKQAILELPTVGQRLEKALGLMESEISVLQVEKRIRSRVKRQMEKTQREYYLNEQMKAIQKELGDDEGRDELAELEDKIEKTKFTKEARDKAMAELKKLRQMSPMSAEATVVRNYLDWLLGIPWGKRSKIKKDLVGAQTILDDDHFGLEKVKERIVECLERRRVRQQAAFASPALIPNLIGRRPGRLRHLPPALALLALAVLALGLARPHATVSVAREEATVVLAIDTSRSMVADDVPPSRLAVAQRAVRRFLQKLPEGYRVGMVSFSQTAQAVLPATANRAAAQAALRNLRTGDGTALGEGIARALQVAQRVRNEGGTRPPAAILVLSDGAQTQGVLLPQQAAQRARTAKVPVYTVAFGTPQGVVEVVDENGFTQRVTVPPDPPTLRQVAMISRGRFYAAPDGDRLNAVYDELQSRIGHEREQREITAAFAALGAFLLLAAGGVSAFLFGRIP